jgi:hypothetical protein
MALAKSRRQTATVSMSCWASLGSTSPTRALLHRRLSIDRDLNPNCWSTMAISEARFWASESYLDPLLCTDKVCIPANHSRACGVLSSPSRPTCRGIITRWSAILSLFRCSVSLFSVAIRSFAAEACRLALAAWSSSVEVRHSACLSRTPPDQNCTKKM